MIRFQRSAVSQEESFGEHQLVGCLKVWKSGRLEWDAQASSDYAQGVI